MPLCRLAALYCILLGSISPVLAQNYAAVKFQVKPGPHAVGVKLVEQYDRTRSFGTDQAQAEHPRPLQTVIWYPAQKSDQPTMTMRDYLAMIETETTFGKPTRTKDTERLQEWFQKASGQVMSAVRDAHFEDGHFPVVIYSPSFSSGTWQNADLCEYLASHGYVVISSPAMGANSRESTHDLQGVDAQAKDIIFLIDYAATLPDTDRTKVAAIGFSWGGLANLFAASRDPRIKALVSLDGSERYFPGLVQASGTVHPDQMTIPLIYFEEGDQSLEDQDKLNSRFHAEGPNVLNQWLHGDLITVHMLGLFHPEFYSNAYRNEELWEKELTNLQVADYDYADGLVGFSWVMQYTQAFLDFYLKHDTQAGTFLKASPSINGAPRHTMSVKVRTAAPASKSN